MGKTIDINKDQLYDLYINKGYTQKKCAEIFGVESQTISRYLKRFNIPSRGNSSNLIISMTDEMYEVLRGALLGDGSLYIPSCRCVNARFVYESKSYDHVKYVSNWFSEYSNHGIEEITRYHKYRQKYYHINRFYTKVSQTFTQEYYKWYVNGIKHIPEDLVLTPLMCKIWYLGDGFLASNHTCTGQTIGLSTNCFLKDELERTILPQLEEFSPRLQKVSNYDQYIIMIGKKINIKKFLQYIGECPFDDYLYKWAVKEPKRKSLLKQYKSIV